MFLRFLRPFTVFADDDDNDEDCDASGSDGLDDVVS